MLTEDYTTSVQSDHGSAYNSDSGSCYYSDRVSTDVEEELYSRIYNSPIKGCTMDGYSSDYKVIDVVEDLPSSEEVCGNKPGGFKSELQQVKPSACLDHKKEDGSIMSFMKACHTSTPVCPPRKHKGFSDSRVKNFRGALGGASAKTSDDDSIFSDDSVICIDSWDSTVDNVLTNIKGTAGKYLNDSQSGSSTSSNDVSREHFLPITVASENSSCSEEHSTQLSRSCPPYDNNSKTAEESLWRVDLEDSISPHKASGRYYRRKSTTCRNCREHGHSEKTCQNVKVIKCFLCGSDGHKASKCVKRVCGVCYSVGHSRYRCMTNLSDVRCGLCQTPGHVQQRCPDIWRRYHLTTSGSKIVKVSKQVKEHGPKYCYNCGREGHFGHNCIFPRFSGSLPGSPFVISYKNPSYLLSDTVNVKNKCNKGSKSSKALKRHSFFYDSVDNNNCKVNRVLTFHEQDFIRTPKNNVDKPEISPERKLRMMKRRRRRRLKQRLKKLGFFQNQTIA